MDKEVLMALAVGILEAKDEHIIANLKAYRDLHGKVVPEVARALGYSISYVYAVEAGARRPSKRYIKRFCELFFVDEWTLRYAIIEGSLTIDNKIEGP
jgi:transcriptional regulator with XRE-family HTH domain